MAVKLEICKIGSLPTKSDKSKFDITKDFVQSKTSNKIVEFSFGVYERDSLENSKRPITYDELYRYCIKYKGNDNGSKKVNFNKLNDYYFWSKCDVILNFVEEDSLKDLPVKEKLVRIGNDEVEFFDQMPFEFERNKIYHLFGLPEIEGSYYLSLNEDNSLHVEYFDGGPW